MVRNVSDELAPTDLPVENACRKALGAKRTGRAEAFFKATLKHKETSAFGSKAMSELDRVKQACERGRAEVVTT
jgi:hypothetical protein